MSGAIPMQEVQSSQIEAVGYDAQGQRLRIRFRERKSLPAASYDYANVPPDVHVALMAAPSVGSFFGREIKRRPDLFPFTRVAEEAPAPAADPQEVPLGQ